MNKIFQSENLIDIDINISYFNRSADRLKALNEKYLPEVINNDILSLKEAKYFPLSEENKLYFMDTEDKNVTLVFALKNNHDKGMYYYRLIDIGYICKEKKCFKKEK